MHVSDAAFIYTHACSADRTVHTHTCAIYCLHVHTHIEHEARLLDFTWLARNWDKSLFAKRQALVSGVRPCNDRVLFEYQPYFYTYIYTSRSTCLQWAYLLWRFVHQWFLQFPLLPSGNCILIWWITANDGSGDEKMESRLDIETRHFSAVA